MGRQPRPEGRGLTHHVMARGNNRRIIFENDLDRLSFLGLVEQTRRRRGWRIHAWCLMTNHVHFLITTDEPTLSAGLRDVLGHYARRYNRHHDRRGHLFSQRFRSVLIEGDAQYLTTLRYINRNPVAAGLADLPDQYRWSGYALREKPRPPITLDEQTTLEMLHPIPATARRHLHDLVLSDDAAPSIRAPRPGITTLTQALGTRRGMRAAVSLGHRHVDVADALGITLRAVDWHLYGE